jgi:hypothetical protein
MTTPPLLGYPGLPDWIIGITRDIWEDRCLTTLGDRYAPDIPMRFPAGPVRGNGAVIDGTLATLAEFPDRELLAEDVIGSGPDGYGAGGGGHLSSHRVLVAGTRSGPGVFGAPTGIRTELRCIADSFVEDEVIADEWLCHDFGALVRQFGQAPRDRAARAIAVEGGPDRARRPFTPDQDRPGPYRGTGNGHPLGARLADTLGAIMDLDRAAIRAGYDRVARVHHPGGVSGWGWLFAEARWMRLRAAFPTARLAIHHRIGRADPGQPDRAAIDGAFPAPMTATAPPARPRGRRCMRWASPMPNSGLGASGGNGRSGMRWRSESRS